MPGSLQVLYSLKKMKSSVNVCQHFFIVIHEFTYNNWQKKKKKESSDAYLPSIYVCIEQGNCCGSLFSPVKRLGVVYYVVKLKTKPSAVISNLSVLKDRDRSCGFLRPLVQPNY